MGLQVSYSLEALSVSVGWLMFLFCFDFIFFLFIYFDMIFLSVS